MRVVINPTWLAKLVFLLKTSSGEFNFMLPIDKEGSYLVAV